MDFFLDDVKSEGVREYVKKVQDRRLYGLKYFQKVKYALLYG